MILKRGERLGILTDPYRRRHCCCGRIVVSLIVARRRLYGIRRPEGRISLASRDIHVGSRASWQG